MVHLKEETVLKVKEGFTWKEIAGEGLLLDLETGDYFTIDHVGFEIIKKINGRNSILKVAKNLSSKFNQPIKTTLKDTLEFTDKLLKTKIIEVIN